MCIHYLVSNEFDLRKPFYYCIIYQNSDTNIFYFYDFFLSFFFSDFSSRNFVETNNLSQPMRQKDDTERVDPFDDLKKYKGGFNITNKHYWSVILSLIFTSKHFFPLNLKIRFKKSSKHKNKENIFLFMKKKFNVICIHIIFNTFVRSDNI